MIKRLKHDNVFYSQIRQLSYLSFTTIIGYNNKINVNII